LAAAKAKQPSAATTGVGLVANEPPSPTKAASVRAAAALRDVDMLLEAFDDKPLPPDM
jgi:hypothetical protein